MMRGRAGAIDRLSATSYRIPTDAPESDGTMEWSSTTILIVHAQSGDSRGLGYAYCDAAAESLVSSVLAPIVRGLDVMGTTAAYDAMVRSVRNIGRPGLASSAIAAVDIALWDLKARLLGLPLVSLLGDARERIPAYGSGGFTSYDKARVREQLGRWVHDDGCGAVKMKVGRAPRDDVERVAAAREAIGAAAELFVDANGAYERAQAVGFAEQFAALGITWFEEPVSSDDHAGLRFLRDRAPPGMRIAVGEYGYDAFDFKRWLDAGACDVLQADATRCGGVTGFLEAAVLADASNVPLSAHTAPSLHTTLCCAVGRALNVEYFYDHVRIEHMLFDGARTVRHGYLEPDRSRPGLGLELKARDAARYAA